MADKELTPDEKTLISQVLAGDKKAFRPLVNGYTEDVYQYILQVTGNADLASELTHETFIRAFRYLYSYNREKPFKPWLMRIAANVTRSRLKKESRKEDKIISIRELTDTGDWDEPAYDPLEAVSDALDDISFDDMVTRALRKLSPKYRQALVLRYKMKYSYEEIAEIMDIPLNTVGTRLSRGVDRVRQVLAEEDSL